MKNDLLALKEAYLGQPEILRKAERDWFVAFCGLLSVSAVLTGDVVPSLSALGTAVVVSASGAFYRTVRRYTERGAAL